MSATAKPTTTFWIVSGVALLWNLIGVATYLMQVMMSEDVLAAMPEAERLLYESTPAWATGAYALAVHSGAIASLGLLLRKGWAVPLFIISLVCILVQMSQALFMTNAIEVRGAGVVVMPLIIIAVAVFLLVYSRSARNKGYLS